MIAGDGLKELIEARHCPEYRHSGEVTELYQIILKTERGTPWVRIGHRRALTFGTTRGEEIDATRWPEYTWSWREWVATEILEEETREIIIAMMKMKIVLVMTMIIKM